MNRETLNLGRHAAGARQQHLLQALPCHLFADDTTGKRPGNQSCNSRPTAGFSRIAGQTKKFRST
jgi:hypothetical protein